MMQMHAISFGHTSMIGSATCMTERRSIDVEGYRHTNPIPAASRVGNLLMSGVITGRDPTSGTLPPSLEEQARRATAGDYFLTGEELAKRRRDDVAMNAPVTQPGENRPRDANEED